jgi:hypothetical protein
VPSTQSRSTLFGAHGVFDRHRGQFRGSGFLSRKATVLLKPLLTLRQKPDTRLKDSGTEDKQGDPGPFLFGKI